MIRSIFLLILVVMLIAAARSFLPEETSLVGSGAALAFGFVLLAALQTGTIFSGVKLPRLTGYLACGFLAGPSVFNYVTERMVHDLKLVNGVALGLIALSAGGELNLKRLRPRLRAMTSIGAVSVPAAMILMTVAVFALGRFLPFMNEMTVLQRLVVSLTMGVVLAALSPTVAIAIINETDSAGPVSETVMGVVVMADLLIVFGFAAVNALAIATFGSADGTGGGFGELIIHIFGSVAVGALIGVAIAVYFKKVAQRIALFVFGICFLCAEAGTKLHLDPLIICLTAGLFLENLTDIAGHQLNTETEAAAMPVYAVFFAVAGAGLHWDMFVKVAPVAVALAAIRALALYGGARIGMAIGRVPIEERKFIPYGLYPQSGVSVGLCVLVARHFAGWGPAASTCLLGVMMINTILGPVLFRSALVRCGEAGQKNAAALPAH